MTSDQFEIKVRELYGIPLDYDLDSLSDKDLKSILNGYWADGGKTLVMGIASGYSVDEGHYEADLMMYDLLTELGYGKAARILRMMEKWYS